ncbi:MAG: hypothetical protein AMK72_06590, partial [Planctomycetes bacterium SM23_25]
AYLHGKSIRERVLALINIAHPKFRNDLIQFAKQQKYLAEDQIEMAWEQVRYPEELERYETLRDGTQIFFRPVKPTDEPALADMLYSLSSESVRSRYFTGTARFPHKDVQRLANIDYQSDLAIVGVVPGPGDEEVVAIAQYFLDPKTQEAEVVDYLVQIARRRGVRRFFAKVLPTNKAMLAVFHNSGLKIRTEFDGEAYSIAFDLAPA